MTGIKRPPPCPRCGSTALYRDDDIINGIFAVACMKCGYRIYPGHDQKLSKVVVEVVTARIPYVRACANCGRVMQIRHSGLCCSCANASAELEGEARTAALVEIKRRIDAGELSHGFCGRRRIQPVAKELPEIIEEEEQDMNRKRSCVNCGREKVIVGKGCCYICYTAAKGLSGEAREAALAEVKRKLHAGEIRTWEKKQGATTDTALPAPEGEKSTTKITEIITGGIPKASGDVPVRIRLAIEITVKVTPIVTAA